MIIIEIIMTNWMIVIKMLVLMKRKKDNVKTFFCVCINMLVISSISPTWEEVSALVRKAVSSLLEHGDHVTCAWMGG